MAFGKNFFWFRFWNEYKIKNRVIVIRVTIDLRETLFCKKSGINSKITNNNSAPKPGDDLDCGSVKKLILNA